ncbi:MAG: hypothetical protein M1469_01285 [Bacteroidetes bacterium]|nr:hypothetical protein [Bacteroidota bacterium]
MSDKDYKLIFSIDLAPYVDGLKAMLNMTREASQQLSGLLSLKITTPNFSGIDAELQRVTQTTDAYIASQQGAAAASQKTAESEAQVEKSSVAMAGGMKTAQVSTTGFREASEALFFRLSALSIGMQALKGTFGEWIQKSNEATAAESAYAQALKNRGIYTEEAVKDAKEFADQLQNLTGADNDVVLKTMAQLAAMGLQGEKLKEATKLTADLSILMGRDMAGAARVMADAFNGNTGMLGRYIKGLDEADIKQRGAVSIIEQVRRAVGGQGEAFGRDTAGQLEIYKRQVDDTQKVLGRLLTEGIVPITNAAKPFLQAFQDAPEPIRDTAAAVGLLGIGIGVLKIGMGVDIPAAAARAAAALYTTLIPAVEAAGTAVVVATGGLSLIAGELVYLAKIIYDTFELRSKAAKAELASDAKSIADTYAAEIDRISKLPPAKAKVEWVWEMQDLDKQIAAVQERIHTLNAKGVTSGKDIDELKTKLKALIDAYENLKKLPATIAENEKKAAKAQLENLDNLITTDTAYRQKLDEINAALKITTLSERERNELLKQRADIEAKLAGPEKYKPFQGKAEVAPLTITTPDLSAKLEEAGMSIADEEAKIASIEDAYRNAKTDKERAAAYEQLQIEKQKLDAIESMQRQHDQDYDNWRRIKEEAWNAAERAGAGATAGYFVRAFDEAWTKAFGQAHSLLQRFLHDVLSALVQIAAQEAAMAVFGFIANLATGGAYSAGANLLSTVSHLGLPAHAEGGITTKPHVAFVGEVPEVIMPLSKLPVYMPMFANRDDSAIIGRLDRLERAILGLPAPVVELHNHAEFNEVAFRTKIVEYKRGEQRRVG